MSDMTHLDELEAEAIYIMREVVAECEKPVMLYSIGKDSSVMLHLALKAFYPEKPPFPFLHVNTTWKFKEMIEFRDKIAEKYGLADTLKTAQNFLLNNFYEFGTGSTYYTSTDSDAQLVVALAPYSNKYKSVIDDTLNCMESYKADGGYLYNLDKVYNYNTGELEDPVISGNSTGLALAAYSAMNDFDKAQKIYNEIVNSFECKDVKGAYAYTAGGDENALATADVFTGLTKFYEALKIKETKDALTTTTTTAPANNITTTTTTSTSQAAVAKIKAPKKTSIKKVKGAKKAISVTWKKVSGVNGYEIQVATDKKFKKYDRCSGG